MTVNYILERSEHACSIAQSCLTLQLYGPSPPGYMSMGFSRHEYRSGLPFPPARRFANPEIKPMSPVSLALAGGLLYH